MKTSTRILKLHAIYWRSIVASEKAYHDFKAEALVERLERPANDAWRSMWNMTAALPEYARTRLRRLFNKQDEVALAQALSKMGI